MNDKIEVGAQTSGRSEIEGLVSAIDRLEASLAKLGGNNNALTRMAKQMAEMTKVSKSGFEQLIDLQSNMEARSERMAEVAGARRAAQAARAAQKLIDDAEAKEDKLQRAAAAAAEKKLRQQIDYEQRQEAAGNKFHYRQIEAADTAYAKQLGDYVKFWEKIVAAQVAAENTQKTIQERRDVEMHAEAQRVRADYVATWERMLAERQAIQERRDVEMHNMRQKELVDYVNWWDKMLAEQASKQAKQVEMTRAQNAAMVIVRRSQMAEAISGTVGAGGAIVSGNPAAVGASAAAIANHNDVMREGHSLARGLAGSLGGLWLTYGSLVPLIAGALLAGSLKNVVTVGKEVENQLNFVFALSKEREGVNLDQFLKINDSSLHSIVEAANAMRALAQNGLTASQSLQVLPSILNLATVGEMTVAQAALAATGAVSAFGLSFSEAGRVGDIFAKTAAESNTSVLQITESMKQASTVASLFHVTIEETAGVLGVLAKINITGGAAGTSMTNMLTGLYEPTEKGKRALKELGIETQTTSGALKPFTQLMEELRGSLAGFNDSAKVDLLGSIFTVRGVKAVQQVQENLDSYKQKVGEATTASGFMREVVMKLEDSTDGAFKRLGVSVERTFVKAFSEAAPYVQQLGLHLADAFSEKGGVQSGISNLATNVARLTGFLLENASAVGAVAIGLVGLKIFGPVAALISTATAATAAHTVAQGAAALATEANTVAMGRGAATRAAHIAMIEAQTVATVAGTTATVAWSAVLLPALGALGIALAAGAALWLLFRDNTDAADQANTKIGNSLHVITQQLDKEIERLEKSDKLWNAREGRFNKEAPVTPELLVQAANQVSDVEKRIRASGGDPDKVRNAEVVLDPGTGMPSLSYMHELSGALSKAEENLASLQEQQRRYETIEVPKTAVENVRKSSDQLGAELEKFAKKASEIDSKGQLYQQDEAIRAIYRQAGVLKQDLISNQILGDPKAEAARIDTLRTSLQKLKDDTNSMQSGRAPKEDKKGANDSLNAELKKLEMGLQLEKLQSQADIATAKQQNRRGELGDLHLINAELAAKLSLDQKAVEVAHAQIALTNDAENKKARAQDYENKKASAEKQGVIDTKAAGDARLSMLARLAQEEKLVEAKTLADKGQYVDAYLADYAASYATTIAKVTDDLEMSRDAETTAALASYLLFLTRLQKTGAADARAKELKEAFGAAFGEMDQRIQELFNKSGSGAGLSAIFTNALAAEKELTAAMPELQRLQAATQAQADASGDKGIQKDATDQLKKIESAAQGLRNIWMDVGKSIERSLSDAFNKPGLALGQLLSRTMQYAETQKRIDNDLAKSSKGADPAKIAELQKKATADSASAQVSAYGEMAGAAKNFFNEQSGGYKILATAEKAFRIAELAMTFESMAAKLFATTTVTAAKVTAAGMEAGAAVATVPVVIGAETAKSSAYGVTALAAALAQPFPANLAAFAVVAGMLAAIGIAVSGSGGSGGTPLDKQRQESLGTGSVLGDSKAKSDSIAKSLSLIEKNTYQDLTISNDMLAALRNIESGISGLGALVARDLGGTGSGDLLKMGNNSVPLFGGALANILTNPILSAVGWLVGKFSNVKTTVNDQGLSIGSGRLGNLIDSGVSGNTYADVNTKKSFLGITYSNNNDRLKNPLPTETLNQFTLVLTGMRDGILSAVTALGASSPEFIKHLNNIAVSIPDISTKGLTGEEIQKQLEAAFSKLGDDLAKSSVGGLSQFQKVGEGYLETLMRVAAGYQTVDVVFSSFGKTFGAVGIGSLVARQRLIDLAGGLEEFASKSEFFLKNFFTAGEQAAALKARVDPTLAQYGLSTSGDDASKKFRDYIVALDTTTASGAQAYATLIGLAPAFKAVIDGMREANSEASDLRDQIDELTMTKIELLKKERDALDPANRALFDNLQAQKNLADAKTNLSDAYDREVQSITTANDRLKSFGTSLRSFLDTLVLGSLSPLTPEEKYAAARGQFDSTLAKAQGGDVKAQDGLQAAANAYLEASRVTYASGSAYTSDFQRVTAAVASMASWADAQVNVGTASLDQLKLQVGALIDIKTAVQTLPEALVAFMAAKAAAAGPFVTPPIAGALLPGTIMPTPISGSGGVSGAASMQAVVDELNKAQAELAAVKAAINTQTGALGEAIFAAAQQAAEKQATAVVEAAKAKMWAVENQVVAV